MEPDLHDRHGFMRAFRQVLTARGFAFCDSGEPEQPQFGLPEAGRRGKALLLEGVEASSTDNPQQSIDCTLDDDAGMFWSSMGSQAPEANEYLLYKLRSPLCLVQHVQLIVFRAHYQFGTPVYPPSFISFQCGPSPWSLAPPTIKFPVAATDAVQAFPMPADLPAGRYLRVNLHGKRQQQLEDMQWYHAIQQVEAWGERLSAAQAVHLQDWTACQLSPLPAPGVVPAYLAASVLRLQDEEHLGEEQPSEGQHEQVEADLQRQESTTSSLSFTH